MTRLERAKPAHLPDDVEGVLGVGLRKLIAGHGDSQPLLQSSGASGVPSHHAANDNGELMSRILLHRFDNNGSQDVKAL
jgi:hypothetical protein